MTTAPVQILEHAELREPVLVQAYAGWNDGGEAASHALSFLLNTLQAERIAVLETEEFLDFTVARPRTRAAADGGNEIEWPDHEFFAVRSEAQPFDLVLGLGVEPHLRWRRYASSMIDLVQKLGIRQTVLLGAYLDEVIYSQPIQVTGSSSEAEPDPARDEGGRYEGPTGIVGVLANALQRADIGVLSLWAGLPHYVSRTPNARASLALLQELERVLGYRFDLAPLAEEAGEFDREVSDQIANDPQLVAYVRELKKRAFSQ